jgi:hypothetical protein
LYSSINTVTELISGKMKWSKQVAYMGEMRHEYRTVYLNNLKRSDHFGDLGIDGRMISKGVRVWTGFK